VIRDHAVPDQGEAMCSSRLRPSATLTRWISPGFLLASFWLALLADVTRAALPFLAVGDWGREGGFNQREVAEQMNRVALAIDAQFVISLGDNFYPDGVADTESLQWQTSFERIYTGRALQVPWYVVLGNHDYHLNAQAQVDYTLVSPRWKMPARSYSLTRRIDDETTVEFFFLDSNPYLTGYRANPAKYRGILDEDPARQTAWLAAALARSTAAWKIVCAHHPLVSASSTHGDTPELAAAILPLLQRHGVQLYLNGHEHDLQHLQAHGIDFFCSGAGSQTRPTRSDSRTRFSLGETPGFLTAVLRRDQAELRFVDATGRERYATVVQRQANRSVNLHP
jgi:tartrate-resistant acid phosphatase type 5